MWKSIELQTKVAIILTFRQSKIYQSLKSYRKQHVELQTVVTTWSLITAHVFAFAMITVSPHGSRCCLASFHFTLKDCLEHFLQGRSSGNEPLSFCLFENVFISPSFLQDSFPRYRIIDWFSLGPFDEKSVYDLMEKHLHVELLLSSCF